MMKYKPNLQKRFWLGTVWLGHTDSEYKNEDFVMDELVCDAYRQWWAELASHSSVEFAEGQIEVGADENLHIQVAVKTKDSKRWSWMAKNLKASWQPAISWGAVTNYCKKTADRIEYLGVVGTKPKSKTQQGHGLAKMRAIKALKAGHTPTWIAVNDTDAYFTHWRAIENLWEKMSSMEAMQLMAEKLQEEE
jgi:hypothetical protein